MQKDSSISAVDIEIDDDITSSLNTLLDTGRCEEGGGSSSGGASTTSDRIVWTYNAPVTAASEQQHRVCAHTLSNGSSSSSTASSSSPLRSGSPASPTSVSSSVHSFFRYPHRTYRTHHFPQVMSSQSGSRRLPYTLTNGPHSEPPHYPHGNLNGGDYSVSEAISNISSPDYRDDDDSVGIRDLVMEISDHSDSDSTLLVSEPRQRAAEGDHRIVIQVKGPERERERARQNGSKYGNGSGKGKEGAVGHQVSLRSFTGNRMTKRALWQ